ncbi:TIM22 inner membrane protein import complex and succinate dehydrogenase (SDH) anchor subunit Tim18 [Schizosaccharomyces pombe]|uniref:Succinate dehydrogenase [ubiquinone] cytochrome b small subunit, mitochondrial n=1 Tax=Schizosaccharomyces pombe (strain 972 / ATCC 24843) TaxID=284812 RepID=DHSD_SCHPO|nr:TIM22 inner membrane protein import complex anchor subunit Tim18 [Schizosaccharomyces pombe]Q9P7X0.2 RecName: Full=Succinate dehydrogenase [ubiquinone] cytochrome b small subunit, mitochondrial; Short=CybS; AltName: Full=Succinate-ubiquinone reductase membrane anchor subunit; Flags: Precursor [Schizosaccharomyces pombe 972h-]CAB66444.2 TIM22 inner membrane protein import complex anchor subunit Tim18 [Schizosaccharomyces pombe]|eukprot:NP_595828.2 TIM22 inner membrane protein import complex anchor subunit Tim18 [Schizosaccharomyces pombe]
MLQTRLGLGALRQGRLLFAVKSFSTTSVAKIFPPPPQTIKGTVNDAAVFPHHSKLHGSYHWDFERIIAIAMVPQVMIPLFTGTSHPLMDAALACTLITHAHLGFESCVIDYFPARRFKKLSPLMHWILRGCTVLTLIGVYEFNTNDIGLTEGIKKLWKS